MDNPVPHLFLDQYRWLATYNRWFNARLYDACERLPDEERRRDRGAFFRSVHGTLNHLMWGDRVWLRRFAEQGVRFEALTEEVLWVPEGALYETQLYEDWGQLRAARRQLDDAIESWVGAMSPDFLASTMRYANTKGVRREHAAWKAMTHFFNHQTHHRGQVTTLLMQAGVDPGVTDMLAMP
ncbi:damage-inducible protein DinB [Ramlibacter henchirensis]|uniref:Damage-inducible protein DinB n=1 Tax=Ramlibacter henchirensis TaxID=204072 RepID=A0A4Z0C6S8_9BURK|nr:DinB family protein [Ramlibacter henchirensis]TFZ05799.1 damage-inducible protein DinB [Ramlibacter henchirensis]